MGVTIFPQQSQDDTLLPYFGWAGSSFPFIGNATDQIISSNTTWSDSKGYRQVKKLTINSGVTLTIERTPFFIFCDELVSGSSTAVIDASGKNGSTTPTVFPESFASGGSTGVAGRSQGGGGGGMLFIICRKNSFAGTIKANGGNGFSGTSATAGGQGALSNTINGVISENWSGTVANNFNSTARNYLHPLASLMASSGVGGSAANVAAGGGSGSGLSSSYTTGGSGIGAGGSYASTAYHGDAQMGLTPASLVLLANSNCRGGGGGGAWTTLACGGGGGSVVIWSKTFALNPTLQANGGLGANTGGNGGAGVTHQIAL